MNEIKITHHSFSVALSNICLSKRLNTEFFGVCNNKYINTDTQELISRSLLIAKLYSFHYFCDHCVIKGWCSHYQCSKDTYKMTYDNYTKNMYNVE